MIVSDVIQAVGGAAICLQLVFGMPGYRVNAEIRGVTICDQRLGFQPIMNNILVEAPDNNLSVLFIFCLL